MPLGQILDVVGVRVLLQDVLDELPIDSFASDGLEAPHHFDVIASFKDTGVPQDHQHPLSLVRNETEARSEHKHTRSFRANEGSSNIKTVFQQKGGQIVARHPARNAGKLLTNVVRIAIAKRSQRTVDCASSSTLGNDA